MIRTSLEIKMRLKILPSNANLFFFFFDDFKVTTIKWKKRRARLSTEANK